MLCSVECGALCVVGFCWVLSVTLSSLIAESNERLRPTPCLVTPQGKKSQLQMMYEEWPFFQATIDLIEMCVDGGRREHLAALV
jgi:hypothetical protein